MSWRGIYDIGICVMVCCGEYAGKTGVVYGLANDGDPVTRTCKNYEILIDEDSSIVSLDQSEFLPVDHPIVQMVVNMDPKAIEFAVSHGIIESRNSLLVSDGTGLRSFNGLFHRAIGDFVEAYWLMDFAPGGFMGIRLAMFEFESSPIPHFHFYRGLENPDSNERMAKGGGCICFLEPKYLAHGDHNDTLSVEEMDAMISYLKTPISEDGATVWQWLASRWGSTSSLSVDLTGENADENEGEDDGEESTAVRLPKEPHMADFNTCEVEEFYDLEFLPKGIMMPEYKSDMPFYEAE